MAGYGEYGVSSAAGGAVAEEKAKFVEELGAGEAEEFGDAGILQRGESHAAAFEDGG